MLYHTRLCIQFEPHIRLLPRLVSLFFLCMWITRCACTKILHLDLVATKLVSDKVAIVVLTDICQTVVEEQRAVVDELESESVDEPKGIETNIVVKEVPYTFCALMS